MKEVYLQNKVEELEDKCVQQTFEIVKLKDQLLGVTDSDMQIREALTVLMKAYVAKNFGYRLLYPSIIVRVIPKPDKYGFLFVPDEYKNKPTYEGVVMQTWEKKIVKTVKGEIEMVPTFKQGDIVLFHHWAGQPVPNFGDDRGEEWRIVPDKHLFNKPGVLDDASPFVIIDHDLPNPKKTMIDKLDGSGLFPVGWTSKEVVNFVFKEFDVTVKHNASLTNYVEPTRPD